MENQPPSSPIKTEKADNTASGKQAACLNCRRSKTRCLRDPGDLRCKKCTQTRGDCVVPEYRVGRKKGIKNKRDGLEKAVYRIEQAIKKSKTEGSQSEDGEKVHLKNLLNDATHILPGSASSGLNKALSAQGSSSQTLQSPRVDHFVPPKSEPIPDQNSDDQFAVDDAENPLQLLARASDLSVPSSAPTTSNFASRGQRCQPRDQDLEAFFGPFRPSLDIGQDVDPIEMGIVTEDESTGLFSYFYENLSHTRWGLDPLLHTPHFVQQRSAFLFTSILAASALFIPTAGALFKRLSIHCKYLSRKIIASRNRSPEIVLAYMINIPWMAPGKHWSDDETCSYMAMALTIALDISLDKLIVPSPSDPHGNCQAGRAQSECITAKKALDLDGFGDVDPRSDFGKRLLRRRERIWLALFVLDRGVCLARGRSFIVPVTPLIETCDDWHRCEVGDGWDGSIVSSAILRRDLVDLISDVKRSCDSNRTQNVNGEIIVQSLQQMIDNFFDRWYTTWTFTIGGTKGNSIPPYVEILVTHGRLSIYSSVINHPTAPVEVKRFFRAAGLSSSLNVMRAAVQGESRLKSMPNNTCIMISFAACFAIYLSAKGNGTTGLATSIKVLIEESAGVLERIGAITPHRNGTSRLYGRHLREVVGSELRTVDGTLAQSAPTLPSPQVSRQPYPVVEASSQAQLPPHTQAQMYQRSVEVPPMQMQFSAMSDDQINEAINNAGPELDMSLSNFQMDDRTGLDWLNWFNMDVNSSI
ncbi:Satratoxin biosynthesis SC1 cluster transcription factor [Lachnellula occidentalis]|uniref:Satratoxin biosynthesis SC1 cluster transcription factor n=1 Tax=Lachnellula occidentalis TaxID=215460 RepID=A0A8H8U9P1_9HELO|nr:Satratoxin biosynthesis SC1 cluster transcription factor [Lachnellula occidentalis]